jgi:hypothetical protein
LVRFGAPGIGSCLCTWRWFVLVQSVCEPLYETVRAGMLWYALV